jgi:hypothetical protein
LRRRLIRWFFFSFLFALVPLLAVLLIRFLAGQLNLQALQENSSEILFFALMICVTSLGDLNDLIEPVGKDDLLYGLSLFFVFGAVISAVLYGTFIFELLVGSNIVGFRRGLMWLSIGLGVVLFIVGTLVQVLLARVTEPRARVTP